MEGKIACSFFGAVNWIWDLLEHHTVGERAQEPSLQVPDVSLFAHYGVTAAVITGGYVRML